MELGQHPMPDGTVSFYTASPSGFDIELGAGGNLMGPALRELPVQGSETSSWGHDLSMRARLRVAWALATQPFRSESTGTASA